MTGRMPGSVTCQSRRQRPAPSAAAASYSDGSMVESAARKMIEPQPTSFHTPSAVTSTMKASALFMMFHGSTPRRWNSWASRPGAAEHLDEERDDEHPAEEMRQVHDALNERAQALREQAVRADASTIGSGKKKTS